MKLRYNLINQKYIGEDSNTTIDTTTPEGMKQLANVVKDSKIVLGYANDTFTLGITIPINSNGQIIDGLPTIIKSVGLRETLEDPTCWVHIETPDLQKTSNLTCSEHFDDLDLNDIDIQYINGEQVIDIPPTFGTLIVSRNANWDFSIIPMGWSIVDEDGNQLRVGEAV